MGNFLHNSKVGTNTKYVDCYSLVDSPALSVLQSRVRTPSIPSKLFPFIVYYTKLIIVLKKDENKQKEAGFGPHLKKNTTVLIHPVQILAQVRKNLVLQIGKLKQKVI